MWSPPHFSFNGFILSHERRIVKTVASLVNFDELFLSDPNSRILPSNQQLVNKKTVEEYMKEAFSGASDMTFKAHCGCEKFQGSFNEGITCPDCGELVKTPFANDLSYTLWIEMPSFAPPVLQPTAFMHMDKFLGSYERARFLHALLGKIDKNKKPLPIPQDIAAWYTPGWVSFYEQFDRLMQYLLTEYKPFQRASERKRLACMPAYLQINRDKLFTRKFPILNSTLHLMTSSGDLRYVDKTADHISELIVNTSVAQYQFDHGFVSNRPAFINKRTWSICNTIYEYTWGQEKSILAVKLTNKTAKKGFIRHNTMGIRAHFTFRGVMIPITEEHKSDELHIPWRIAVECMKLEIVNLLVNRRGLTLEEAWYKCTCAEDAFDQEIYDILEVLIAECSWPGLPVLFNRNPSLRLGSIQLLFVTRVLKDSSVIAMSPLVMNAPNADWRRKSLGPHSSNIVVITSLIAGTSLEILALQRSDEICANVTVLKS